MATDDQNHDAIAKGREVGSQTRDREECNSQVNAYFGVKNLGEEPKTCVILKKAAQTFQERNAVYKDNANNVANTMGALFPNGVVLNTPEDFNRWHLFELLIVKLTRFANSGLMHKDSIHDAMVYAAMVESLIENDTKEITGV